MVAPGLLGYESAAADSGHIAGPLIVTFSTIALWEATFVVRKWNIPVAVWLLISPWLLAYDSGFSIASDTITGILVLIFSFQKRSIQNNYGGGWSALWKRQGGDSAGLQ
jgi:hypothetical protein